MNCKQERDPGRPPLPTAEKKLRVPSIANRKVHRRSNATAEIGVDFPPVGMRTESDV